LSPSGFFLFSCADEKSPAVSKHSRAAKRASSPSIDTDKSLKNVKAPEATEYRPSVLAIHQGAGVNKKSKSGRKAVLSAKAKRRQEKGMDRAEAVMDIKAAKIEKSKGRARNVQERSKAWEELNKKILAQEAADAAAAAAEENNEWEDAAGDDEAMMNDVTVEEATPAVPATTTTAASVAQPIEEDEEIL
jgi:hypothetical protein